MIVIAWRQVEFDPQLQTSELQTKERRAHATVPPSLALEKLLHNQRGSSLFFFVLQLRIISTLLHRVTDLPLSLHPIRGHH